MARLRGNFSSGTLLAGVGATDTSFSSAGLASLPVVASPDTLALTIDPLSVFGAPEIVIVTAHGAASTSATILRHQEGTSARSHVGPSPTAAGEAWVWAPTAQDWSLVRVFNVVTEFGADPTGVADSTVAIQNAVTALKTAGGGTLFFPPGTYLVGSSTFVDLTNVNNALILGYGATLTLPTTGSGTPSIIYLANSTGLTFQGLKFNSPWTSGTWSIVLMTAGTLTKCRFLDCYFLGTVSSGNQPNFFNLNPTAAGGIQDLEVVACRFESPGTGSIQVGGLLVRGFVGMSVVGCTFVNVNNPILPESTFPNFGLVYSNNLELITNVTNPVEGPDIMGTTGVTYTGNVQYATVAMTGTTDAGGALFDTGGGFGIADVVCTGNVFVQNPVQVSPRAPAGDKATNILIANNDITGGRSTANVNNCITLYADPNSASSNVTVQGNNLHGTFTGVPVNVGAGYSNLTIRNNPGYNPVGVVTPAVPTSGTAVAAQPYDRTFYVTTGAGATTIAIQGGPTITLTASVLNTVRVPAGQTMTPTYANAPTWVVEGD